MHEKDALMLQAEELSKLASPCAKGGKGGGKAQPLLTIDAGDSEDDDDDDSGEEGEVMMLCPTKLHASLSHIVASPARPGPRIAVHSPVASRAGLGLFSPKGGKSTPEALPGNAAPGNSGNHSPTRQLISKKSTKDSAKPRRA
jgi:hypothetical protein